MKALGEFSLIICYVLSGLLAYDYWKDRYVLGHCVVHRDKEQTHYANLNGLKSLSWSSCPLFGHFCLSPPVSLLLRQSENTYITIQFGFLVGWSKAQSVALCHAFWKDGLSRGWKLPRERVVNDVDIDSTAPLHIHRTPRKARKAEKATAKKSWIARIPESRWGQDVPGSKKAELKSLKLCHQEISSDWKGYNCHDVCSPRVTVHTIPLYLILQRANVMRSSTTIATILPGCMGIRDHNHRDTTGTGNALRSIEDQRRAGR